MTARGEGAPAEGVDLDDVAALLAADPGVMLRAVAGSGAQVRAALATLDRAVVRAVADAGRPRGLVVAGMGGSGIAGDVLSAVAGVGAPLPVQTVRSHTLPGWVGALDVVVAVSCSGRTAETLLVAQEAARRGARLVGIGAAGSPLADVVTQGGGAYLTVDAEDRMPRASLWTLAVPLLVLGSALGVTSVTDDDLAAAADVLDEVAREVGVEVEVSANRAKAVALALADGVPTVWGSGPLAGVAAYRLACQLNENAKLPCAWGVFPEVLHNQVVAFDGRYGVRDEQDELFRDPLLDGPASAHVQLLLLRDDEVAPDDAARVELAYELAAERGMRPLVLSAHPGPAVVRLASLVGQLDWVSVYTALALGEDPTPIPPIVELKARLGVPATATDTR